MTGKAGKVGWHGRYAKNEQLAMNHAVTSLTDIELQAFLDDIESDRVERKESLGGDAFETEPPRDCRRLIYLSYAAMSKLSMVA